MQNYLGEVTPCGEDFQALLSRTSTKRERLVGLIEAHVLQTSFLPLPLTFCEAHPAEGVCDALFRDDGRDINGIALLKRVQRLGIDEKGEP